MSREYDITYVNLRDEKVKEHESKCFYEMKKLPHNETKNLYLLI